jgi:hypothetical protein
MRTHLTMGMLMVTLAAGGAAAQETEGVKGSWSISLKGGIAGALTGDVHDGGTGTVLGLPTSVEPRGYDEVYDTAYGFRAGLGYGISRRAELFGDFTWGRSEASPLSVGNVAGLDLQAQFADYRTYGVEGGLRYHFAPDAPVNPYIAGVGGFLVVDAIPATFSVPAAGVVLRDTPFYDKSTVPTFGGDFGLLLQVAPAFGFGIEAGLRYQATLDSLPGLAGTGLENLNQVGDRWSFPVVGTLMIRF